MNKVLLLTFSFLLLITQSVKAQTLAVSDDFSNGFNWFTYNTAGNADDWTIGTTPPSGNFAITAITSTSGGNFALFDSDLMCSGDQQAYLEFVNAIVLDPLATTVTVSFEQFYRKWTDQVFVEVSLDGNTWTPFEVNSTFLQDDESPINPENVNIDISSVAAGQSSILIRFAYISGPLNGGDGCDYSWMVDDFSVSYDITVPVNADFTVDITSACVGSNFVFTDASTGTITDYQWDFGPDASPNQIENTAGPHTVNFSSPGLKTITLTVNTGADVETKVAFVEVFDVPTVTNPGNFTFCDNAPTSDINFSGTATSYSWTNDNTSFGIAASGTGDILSFSPTGTGPQTATLTVTPISGTCSGSPEVFTVDLNHGEDPAFAYSQATYCFTDANPIPVVNTAGGTFTFSPAGLAINASTGEIDLFSTAANTYDVTYTTPSASCPGVHTVQVTVGSGPTVNPISSVSFCEGAATTDIVFTGSVGSTFSWVNSNTAIGIAANGTGDILSFVPLNGTANPITAVVDVTAVIGTCTGNTESFIITINPQDDASFTISSATACSNDVPNAPVTTITGASGGTFSSGAGLIIDSNTGTIDVSASTPGIYTVTYDVNGTCPGTSSQAFELIETPVISAASDISACSGDVVPSIDIVSLSTFAIDWTNDNTATGITNANGVGDIASFIADNPVNGGAPISSVITLTSTNNGCVSAPVTFNVIVNAIPTVNAGTDRTICEGTSITMSGTGSATTLTWDNNITNGVAFTPSSGTYIYTLTGTTNGCSNIDQAIITVNSAPIVVAGVDKIVCSGSTTTLTAVGAPILTWNNGVVNNVPFVPFISGDYIVTGIAQNGCTSSDTLVITVESLPIPSFTVDVTSGCVPTNVIFNSSPTTNTCVYSFSDGTIENGCSNVSHTFSAVGTYDVTLTQMSVNNCIGSTTIPGLITIHPDPVASFTVDRTDLTMIDPTTSFTNTSTGAIDYLWSFGYDSQVSTDFEPTNSFPDDAARTYTVSLVATTQYGCHDTAYAVVVIEESLLYYIPNSFTPNGDEFNNKFTPLFYSGFDPQDYNLKIFNRLGELIFESNDAEQGWDGDYGAGRGLAPSGTYTYKLQFNTSDKDEKKVVVGHVNVLR